MILPGEENQSLLDRLKEATEFKQDQFNDTVEFETIAPDPVKPNADDFDEPSYTNDTDPQPQPEPEPEPKPFEFYLQEARGIVKLIDNIQQLFIPRLYKKKFFVGDELHQATEALKKADKREELTEYDSVLIKRLQKVASLIDELPYSDQEIETVAQPLAETMQKYQGVMGPETRLIIALGSVSATRIIPLFNV